jgi:hypothetical protein
MDPTGLHSFLGYCQNVSTTLLALPKSPILFGLFSKARLAKRSLTNYRRIFPARVHINDIFFSVSLKHNFYIYILLKIEEQKNLKNKNRGSSPTLALVNNDTFSQFQTGAKYLQLQQLLSVPCRSLVTVQLVI